MKDHYFLFIVPRSSFIICFHVSLRKSRAVGLSVGDRFAAAGKPVHADARGADAADARRTRARALNSLRHHADCERAVRGAVAALAAASVSATARRSGA